MIRDKATLAEKVEELLKKCAEGEGMEKKFEILMKKEKEIWSVSEKIRREKWEGEKVA